MAIYIQNQQVENFRRCINCEDRKPVTKDKFIYQCCFHPSNAGMKCAEINHCPKLETNDYMESQSKNQCIGQLTLNL